MESTTSRARRAWAGAGACPWASAGASADAAASAGASPLLLLLLPLLLLLLLLLLLPSLLLLLLPLLLLLMPSLPLLLLDSAPVFPSSASSPRRSLTTATARRSAYTPPHTAHMRQNACHTHEAQGAKGRLARLDMQCATGPPRRA